MLFLTAYGGGSGRWPYDVSALYSFGMDRDAIDVFAKISLVATEDGGRSSPLNPDYPYRPNHNFFGLSDDRMCMVEVTIPDGSSPKPGDTFEAKIRLIIWPELRDKIKAGRQWNIQEGAKVVAIGEVLEVLASS